MKIVIVGYGEMFDSLVAGTLASGHQIVGVFRHENVIYNPLKKFIYDYVFPSDNKLFIKSLGLYDIKATSVNSKKFREEVKKLDTDIILVGSWSEKFTIETINSPKVACINVHPSLLPKYRGPNPYIQVILNNEKKSGITFHLMNEYFDKGAILYQIQTDISEDETGLSLKLKCCELARKSVIDLLNSYSAKIQIPINQNEEDSSYQSHISLRESILNFKKEDSSQITRRIRALTPWINCHIAYNNEFFTFEKFKVCSEISKLPPSTIIKKSKNSIFIVCKDNRVIEFSGLKLKRPILSLFTKFYIKYFIKINSKVL